MTLRMADGPVANLPPGFDAYAGYVNASGIGVTYPQVVAKFPTAQHLSITTNGSPAMCADVETGAMKSWRGYDWGYCAVFNVNALIRSFGRPRKLWTAHYNDVPHICSPACWPGLVTTADGTQWTDHGGSYDESLLAPDFFSPPTSAKGAETMSLAIAPDGTKVVERVNPAGHLLVFTQAPGQIWSVTDVTAAIAAANPGTPPFVVEP